MPGWKRRLPLALGSLALHGLLIAALVQAAPSQPIAGNNDLASERVQLRFVSADSIEREQGAAASAATSPLTSTSTAASSVPDSTVAKSLPAPAPRPQVVLASTVSAAEPVSVTPAATSVAAAAASPAAAATAQLNASAASHGAAGRGQAAHGHGSAAHSSAPALDSQGVADWSQAVMRRLARFRSYPAAARAQRVEGVVMVHATIAADGQVLATRVRHSCGNPDLDAEALATFSRARRLPAPPAYLPSPLQVDLPVAFSLRS
ncbi:MAG: energy transducer TonB [Stenotrophomonas sp.]